MKLRIGTRKSRLALAQTDMVVSALKKACPGVEAEIVHITTRGDRILDRPLLQIGGKGVFIGEIERELLSGGIDIAVHSAKDLSNALAEGTEIAAVLERGKPNDVLAVRRGMAFGSSDSFMIGTGSLRRRGGAARIYPNAVFADIRGNVDTRLNKLAAGEYDAVILAAAGLERLGMMNDERFTFTELPADICIPAPCQAIIAVQSVKGKFSDILSAADHSMTHILFNTEREVLRRLDSGCTLPVGAFARYEGDRLVLSVTDGKSCAEVSDMPENWRKMAEKAVKSIEG
ncbi:MAG: hydroxymethylbilane synthase [Ruminococcus sp.]|nr:hydroxymethylbilane synthase [Ruminococcus sp.]